MNNRMLVILGGYVTSSIFLITYFTANYSFLGSLLGFLTGLFNFQWLFIDSKKALNKDLTGALKIYYKSLFSRLGMVTLVVATVGRFRPEWLFYLALGIAAGIIMPLMLVIFKNFLLRGGER